MIETCHFALYFGSSKEGTSERVLGPPSKSVAKIQLKLELKDFEKPKHGPLSSIGGQVIIIAEGSLIRSGGKDETTVIESDLEIGSRQNGGICHVQNNHGIGEIPCKSFHIQRFIGV